MLDNEQGAEPGAETPKKTTTRTRRRTTKKADAAPESTVQPTLEDAASAEASDVQPSDDAPAKPVRRTRKRAAAVAAAPPEATAEPSPEAGATPETADQPAEKPARKRTRKSAKTAAPAEAPPAADAAAPTDSKASADAGTSAGAGESAGRPAAATVTFQPPSVLFQAPDLAAEAAAAARAESPAAGTDDEESAPKSSRRRRTRSRGGDSRTGDETAETSDDTEATSRAATEAESTGSDTSADGDSDGDSDDDDDAGGRRRRRRRGGRRRNRGEADDGDDTKSESDDSAKSDADETDSADDSDDDSDDEGGSGSRRRRRRRRRKGEPIESSPDDPKTTVVKVREPRKSESAVSSVEGSTRLEAKKLRRREGREAGRRRPPILTEAEFLARRESVDRSMAIRQRGDITQIGVLEDNVLVEHYVARQTQTSLIGNVYLGRVQNVLPSMEAAFIDIGRGRNAVLYAGEVDWVGLGLEGQPKRIESALKSGQTVLVQVTKDPIGHKGARLTSQISLPGRYLVYVPHGSMNGISRKLPDTERNRLKQLLKDIIAEDAGVVVRTAAEGASEEELSRDVSRLRAQWESIDKAAQSAKAPELLYAEPDLLIKVVRDLFTEDFTRLVVAGDDAWDMVQGYVKHVAPHLAERLERWTSQEDLFAAFRIDEQIIKALDRKVWLPSGGSLIIERTEAMTVIDVNTGKFTGSGGNLEETVTKNNLEAAEEIVRQLRTRDIGGIIVIDFIDMVLESNRDLVLRRLVECLGRDRTKHQVAEVTSLGLVQMTRKRIGTGLLESFSEPCEVCKGRGHIVHLDPADTGGAQQQNGSPGASSQSEESGGGRRSRRRRGRGGGSSGSNGASEHDHDQDHDHEHEHESDDSGPEASADVAEVDATADAVEVADGAESGKAVEPGTSVEPVVSANGTASDDLSYDEAPTPREDEDNASVSEALEPSVEPVDTTAGLNDEVASAPSAAAFSASGPGRRRRRH